MAINRKRGSLGPVKYGVYLRQKDEENDKKKKINELKDFLFKDIEKPTDFSKYKEEAEGHTVTRRDISPLKDMFGIGAVSYREEYVGPSLQEINYVEKYNASVEGRALAALDAHRLAYAEKVYNGEIIHTEKFAKSLNDNVFAKPDWSQMQKARGTFFKPIVANDAEVQSKIEELKARPVVYRDNPDWDKYHGVMPDHPDPELALWYPEMGGSAEALVFDDTANINIDRILPSTIDSILPSTNHNIPESAKTIENEIPTAVREDYYDNPGSEYGFEK